jgi:hypothetical protein
MPSTAACRRSTASFREEASPSRRETVTNLLDRYEELVALRLWDRPGLQERLKEQGRAVLSIDGLQPDVGHEVLWVVGECLSGELLLARSLLGGTERDLVSLLEEVADALGGADRRGCLRRTARYPQGGG